MSRLLLCCCTMCIMIVTTLSGCIQTSPQSDAQVSTPQQQSAKGAALESQDSGQFEIRASSTPSKDLSETVTPAATEEEVATTIASEVELSATPTMEQGADFLNICTTPATVYDLRQHFGSLIMTELDFHDEDTLVVSGWGPDDYYAEASPEPSASPAPGDIPSASSIFMEGQYNLVTGEAAWQEEEAPILKEPCSGECSYEVISVSPDDRWQLVLVRRRPDTIDGIWLVSSGTKKQLVDFVPSASSWDWANDGSWLWFQYSLPEFGITATFVKLDYFDPLEFFEIEINSALDPTSFTLAIDPYSGTAVSVANPGARGIVEDPDLMRIFDLNKSVVEPVAASSIPGILRVEWNQVTGSYILVTEVGDELMVQELDGALSLRVPFRMLAGHLPEEILRYNLPLSNYALSPSGSRLAVGLGDLRVMVLDCPAK